MIDLLKYNALDINYLTEKRGWTKKDLQEWADARNLAFKKYKWVVVEIKTNSGNLPQLDLQYLGKYYENN